MRLKNKLIAILRGELFKDSVILYIGEGLYLLFAMLISMVRPDILGPTAAGMISYVNSYISTAAIFFSFGFDSSGTRLAMLAPPEEKKRYTGITMYIGLICCAGFAVFTLLMTGYLLLSGQTDAGHFMLLVVPLSGYSILNLFARRCCYATGEMKKAALLTCGYSVIYFPVILLFNGLGFYTAKIAIVSEYSISTCVTLLSLLGWYRYIRPSKELWREIRVENKRFGRKVYLSRIIGMPSFNIDTIILGLFHPMASVSYYALATSFSRPVHMLGNSVAQSMYRKLADKRKISLKLRLVTDFLMILCGFAIWGAGVIVIRFFLDERFNEVLIYLPWMIIVMFIRGATTPYNQYLQAKGRGKEVRMIAIVFAVSSLICNFALIPCWGVAGCVAASGASLVVNYLMQYGCYRKVVKEESLISKVEEGTFDE